MKRSLLDPLPRQLSTQALAVLVALVICGTGIAVARYLDSDPWAGQRPTGVIHAAPPQAEAPWRPTPAPLPSARGGMTSNTGGLPGWTGTDAQPASSSRHGPSTACPLSPRVPQPVRDDQPTLYRPGTQGT